MGPNSVTAVVIFSADLLFHSVIRPGSYLLKMFAPQQLVHYISIRRGSSLAHEGGEWVVIYKNMDRRFRPGVTQREKEENT